MIKRKNRYNRDWKFCLFCKHHVTHYTNQHDEVVEHKKYN